MRRAYITARFTPATLPAFFTLGDQLDYGGFENRALDSGQEYVFFILAELNSTTGVRHTLTKSPLLSLRCCLSFEPGRLSLDNVAGTAALLQQCIACQSSRQKQIENNSVLVLLIKSECSHCDKTHYALHVLMLFRSAGEGGNTYIQYMFYRH